jgi:hypothetical protein
VSAAGSLVPWVNVDRVSVRFSEDVDVDRPDLVLYGINAGLLDGARFAYDAAARTATWTFAVPLAADRMVLAVSGVGDRAGNALSAGASVPLTVLPGDATRDGRVGAADLLQLRMKMSRSTARLGAGASAYSSYHDLDGDGRVSALDVVALRRAMSRQLPPVQPAPPAPLFGARQAKSSDPGDESDGLSNLLA